MDEHPILNRRQWLGAAALLGGFASHGLADEPKPTMDSARALLRPYHGGRLFEPDDSSTLVGKVMTGYQGWFNADGDGSGRGWRHYGKRGKFEPGHAAIDLWPDVSELDADERYATSFRHADGRVAEVFSSRNPRTVRRHFRWMREYGIAGAFVQRFAVETTSPVPLEHCNLVLTHCREGANCHGRVYAVMYDLSGLQAGGVRHVIDDWKTLVDRMRVGRDDADHAYLRHRGKPVVAVWGVGFNDDRKYTLAECAKLVKFLKEDPTYGGNTVMLGVPTGWRTLTRDSVRDGALHEVIRSADVVSPWTVGRYGTLADTARHGRDVMAADIAWCDEHKLDYLPVAFPGFSWHNLRPESPPNQIPRLKGQFLWSQYLAARDAGATMLYQAMFDEVDEGTAIFKCTNDPPVGASPFVDYEGLPSDFYLRLTGLGGKLIRREIEATAAIPIKK
ncbi:MAG: glycoside hydrolase family 71/99-like protein [Pirellulales bacterium]